MDVFVGMGRAGPVDAISMDEFLVNIIDHENGLFAQWCDLVRFMALLGWQVPPSPLSSLSKSST